ncbi:FecCD family ABC transporter permease [Oceanobacillus alkalisoli]|uniref:FecCD family ABC transporter permease n=1 Tax=Oceanobacillus alkalisoli TaxID=2925113 RepID=UPI001EF13E46|nr:iron ABC transporter permease [Oceanobacillus alkalisoli]MCF3943393.1 iron ABC transporter permease [Oceanobacillus alkalisoli]MCG5103982.1 iron ABC transporter permease [Oceanobacillus alkalisoli]
MYKKLISFIAVLGLLLFVSLYSMITGSIEISLRELITGLFTGTNENVEIIKDLRLPRIIIALFAGACLSVSGVLLQAVLRNPLAEPGIIGVSSGAGFVSIVMITFFPTLYFYTPLFSFIGGAAAFLLVYLFAWKSGLDPLRMILIGVAINALFTGLSQLLSAQNASSLMSGISVDASTLTMKTWDDVGIIVLYGTIGLLLSLLLYAWCNHLGLKDKTLRNLGFQVNRARFTISVVAVLLASIATAIAGMFTFVGLLVPHIGRVLVGNDHKVLIPFSALAGALLIVTADTLGRTIMAPIEIPASIIMAVIGGPFLIFLLRKSDRIYGN